MQSIGAAGQAEANSLKHVQRKCFPAKASGYNMHSRGTARQATANAIRQFPMQMLPSYTQLVQHPQQGRSRAGGGQRSDVYNANGSVKGRCENTARLQQDRHGCTYLGAVQLACIPCLPGSCRLRSIEAHSAGVNAVTWFSTRMLPS